MISGFPSPLTHVPNNLFSPLRLGGHLSHNDRIGCPHTVFIRLATSIFNLAADAKQLVIGDLGTDPRGHQTVEPELCHQCLLDIPESAANANNLAYERKSNSLRTIHFDFPQ